MDPALVGRDGEARAVELLRRRGYTILVRNFRRRAGEIDVVALEGGEIVFVEVKARTTDGKGSALEAITPAKKRRLARVAARFLAERGIEDRPCRFDVVAIEADRGKTSDEIVRGAFTLDR